MNTARKINSRFSGGVFFGFSGLFFRFRHRLFFLFRFLPQQRRYRRRYGQAFPQLVNGRNPFVRTDLQGMEQRGLDMGRKLFSPRRPASADPPTPAPLPRRRPGGLPVSTAKIVAAIPYTSVAAV